jgi:hypothetical protein
MRFTAMNARLRLPFTRFTPHAASGPRPLHSLRAAR